MLQEAETKQIDGIGFWYEFHAHGSQIQTLQPLQTKKTILQLHKEIYICEEVFNGATGSLGILL